MYARLLPQGNSSLIAHELVCLGHPNPQALLQRLERPFMVKLIGVPKPTAMRLTQWIEHLEPSGWWHCSPAAGAERIDLILGSTTDFTSKLRRAAQHIADFQPILGVLDQAVCLVNAAPTHLQLGDRSVMIGQRTYVMGILNVTPDSFSDGGLYFQPELAIKHAEEMLAEGADIIDVGGQSSRPGASPIPTEVEHDRVVPVVREIVKRYDAWVSVDTYRASVARAALDVGAVLINDISAMRFDPQMAPLIARSNAAVVCMHMQGTPQTMQEAPTYHHVIDEVYRFLAACLERAGQCGIARHQVLLDPGFGFGKTVQHNLELLRGLEHFRALGQPLLVGTSRKSFLGRLLQREVWDRLEGTLASVVYAVLRGAAVVRVHDVKPVVQAVRLIDALEKPPLPSFVRPS